MEEERETIKRLAEALRDIMAAYPNPERKDKSKAAQMARIAEATLYDLGLL